MADGRRANEDETSRVPGVADSELHCDDGPEGLPINDRTLDIQAAAEPGNIVGELIQCPALSWTILATTVAAKVQVHDLSDFG